MVFIGNVVWSDLRVAYVKKEELSLMQENKSEHARLYESICGILTINPEAVKIRAS